MNRRSFLISIPAAAAGLASLGGLSDLFAEEKKKKAADEGAAGGACDPKKGKAKELNYVPNKKMVKDPKSKVEKMGVPWEKQACKNCVLYKADTSQCLLMTGETCKVETEGWCTSWAKNPNVPA